MKRAAFLVFITGISFLFQHCSRSTQTTPAAESTREKPASETESDQIDMPDWLEAYIEQKGEKEGLIEVLKYRYKGEVVYFTRKACCDRFEEIYSEDGGIICKTGGFTGKGDGNCPDFGSPETSELIGTVWSNR